MHEVYCSTGLATGTASDSRDQDSVAALPRVAWITPQPLVELSSPLHYLYDGYESPNSFSNDDCLPPHGDNHGRPMHFFFFQRLQQHGHLVGGKLGQARGAVLSHQRRLFLGHKP